MADLAGQRRHGAGRAEGGSVRGRQTGLFPRARTGASVLAGASRVSSLPASRLKARRAEDPARPAASPATAPGDPSSPSRGASRRGTAPSAPPYTDSGMPWRRRARPPSPSATRGDLHDARVNPCRRRTQPRSPEAVRRLSSGRCGPEYIVWRAALPVVPMMRSKPGVSGRFGTEG